MEKTLAVINLHANKEQAEKIFPILDEAGINYNHVLSDDPIPFIECYDCEFPGIAAIRKFAMGCQKGIEMSQLISESKGRLKNFFNKTEGLQAEMGRNNRSGLYR